MSLIPYSVFEYESDDGNAITNKTRNPQIRAFTWTREEVWQCSHERLGVETFEERKINTKLEIKARILQKVMDLVFLDMR